MVASGSRTMIAGSLSSCIAGLHQYCGLSQSFGLRSAEWGTSNNGGMLGFEEEHIAVNAVSMMHVGGLATFNGALDPEPTWRESSSLRFRMQQISPPLSDPITQVVGLSATLAVMRQ